MGWMDFVVAMLGAILSWPVIVLIIVLVFRRALRAAIDRLRSYEGMGQKFDFANAQQRAEQSVDAAVPASAPPETAAEIESQATALQGVEQEPALTIITAWERLALSVDELSRLLTTRRSPRASVAQAVEQLRNAGIVNDAFVDAFRELRQMRNAVAHGQHSPTPGEAAGYGTTALELQRACEVLLRVNRPSGDGLAE